MGSLVRRECVARDKGRPWEVSALYNLIYTKLRIYAFWRVQGVQRESKHPARNERASACMVLISHHFQKALSDYFPKARLFLWLKKHETNCCSVPFLRWQAKALMRKPSKSSSQWVKACHWCLQARHSWYLLNTNARGLMWMAGILTCCAHPRTVNTSKNESFC